MKQNRLFFFKILLGVGCLGLASCGGESVRPLTSTPTSDDDDSRTAPLVRITFDDYDVETTNLRFGEGQKVTFELDGINTSVSNASLTQTSGPRVDFGEMSVGGTDSDGNIDIGEGTNEMRFLLQDVEGQREAIFPRSRRLTAEFIMPSVTTRTEMTFQFRASSATQSRTRNVPIIIEDDAGAITLTGQASKGLVSNTKVRLFSVDGFLADLFGEREIVEPVRLDETGTYVFTILPATDFENLLLYKIEGDGADMVCDAPQGCNQVPFGDTLEVGKDLDLRAYIPVPQLGTTQNVNVNILTTLSARSGQDLAEGFERVDPGDVSAGQREVARIFGLPNQNFHEVPFVDVTRPITSTDENAIRAAMIGGGVLGAAFAQSDPDDDDDYLEELEDFIDDFGKARIACKDSPTQTTISIEDVMRYAWDVSKINGSLSTQNFFLSRLSDIQNGVIGCDFTSREP